MRRQLTQKRVNRLGRNGHRKRLEQARTKGSLVRGVYRKRD
jgi:hypothetical protein